MRKEFFGAKSPLPMRAQKKTATLPRMADVTRILEQVRMGDESAAETLLPLVYEELRKLAAHWLAHQPLGQTLQPTALVHEAFLRLVGDPGSQSWQNRGHFFLGRPPWRFGEFWSKTLDAKGDRNTAGTTSGRKLTCLPTSPRRKFAKT